MKLLNILSFAHSLLENVVRPGDQAIDCTVGNGHDTTFLAKLVGEHGHVYGFDIQKQAVTNTYERLKGDNLHERVTLFHASHEHIHTHISTQNKQLKAAIFNLGYLPGGNKEIVTKPSSTIEAIKAIFQIIQKEGMIVLVIYPGHKEGQKEKEEVLAYIKSMDQRIANVLKYEFINQINDPPFVIAIEKK